MKVDAEKFGEDVRALLSKWLQEIDAMKAEQAKYPLNHTHSRIYQAMINQQNADIADVLAALRKNETTDSDSDCSPA